MHSVNRALQRHNPDPRRAKICAAPEPVTEDQKGRYTDTTVLSPIIKVSKCHGLALFWGGLDIES